MKKVIVIGGGPAGMIAAATSAKAGNETILLEKNEKLGKKLYITGKGRCNLTNDCDEEVFLKNVPGNPSFLYSAIYSYNSQYVMHYFEELGIKLKVERGARVFPVSEKASDITRALEKDLHKNNVDIRFYTEVKEVLSENGDITGVIIKQGKKLEADAVVIATGGLAYPVTGSTGDGYKFAQNMGHKIMDTSPSLVPLLSDDSFIKDLAGLSLKNVFITLLVDGKAVYNNFGEMLFTHMGVSGPVILSAGRYLVGNADKKAEISIDLKPALDEKEMDGRILRDFMENKNKDFINSFDNLLPQKLIPIFVRRSGISSHKKVNEITKKERQIILQLFKKFTVAITGVSGYSEAVVTAGGVCTDEINPGTMESKLIKNLYFAGEVIDVDGFTGGFNLQIAFCTGLLAGSLL